jgi:hypothetical protein
MVTDGPKRPLESPQELLARAKASLNPFCAWRAAANVTIAKTAIVLIRERNPSIPYFRRFLCLLFLSRLYIRANQEGTIQRTTIPCRQQGKPAFVLPNRLASGRTAQQTQKQFMR